MVNFPFYRYPYSYYYRSPGFSKAYNQATEYTDFKGSENPTTSNTSPKEQKDNYKVENSVQADNKKTSRYNSFGPINFQNPFSVDQEEPVLEILGIKLYLDDIIILSLLFFLYKEGVQDEMLFLSLILLLLS